MPTISANKTTLGYHLRGRPLSVRRDLGHVSCKHVADTVVSYMGHPGRPDRVSPETSALWFYLGNHAVGLLRGLYHEDEALPPEALKLVTTHYDRSTDLAMRLFGYLVLICTRESRHARDNSPWEEIGVTASEASLNYIKGLRGLNSEEAASRFKTAPPKDPMGRYTEALSIVFHKGAFSSGYGGPAWGEVADCLNRFVVGEYSAEMMLDVGFTLAHNNGPIFNKGMLFEGYDVGAFTRILDVQRAGQLPALALHDARVAKYVGLDLNHYVHSMVAHIPHEVPDYVDWYAVEELGSLGSYGQDKAAQVAKWGKPVAVAKKQAIQAATTYVVDHHTKLPKVKRAA